MSNKLSLMPNISIPRSAFKQNFHHPLDMFHGDVVPVDCFEVIPGDEFSYELKSLIRMSTPIVPVMSNVKAYLHAFFVPLRLIWEDAEKFYGDPSNHDKISSITPVDPASITVPRVFGSMVKSDVNFMYSVQDYLGKVDLYTDVKSVFFDNDDAGFDAWLAKLNLSRLKELAYLCIWNDHFRPSLMVPPVLLHKTSSNSNYASASFLNPPTNNLNYPFKPLKGFKQYDYFTAGTLSPQFGSAVALPLGTFAPVGAIAKATDEAVVTNLNMERADYLTGKFYQAKVGTSASGVWANASVVADLSQALAANINDIRYAFQLKKYFERSNYGSRYFEILNAHYGITNPDSRLQRAERLGSHEFYINISQVVSTADTVNGGSGQNLGNTGAVSVTGDKCHLFTKSFSEPGYVMVVITTKYDRIYSSGLLREDLRKNRFEFYSPEFANLGDQATKQVELHLTDGTDNLYDPLAVHSYQEHWAEYRYRKDYCSGSLRAGSTFDIWTLADSFESDDATPGYDFLKEDRYALSRVLATGASGPDYVCDFDANIIATRELPLYSIPGLIDHFGAL